MMTEVIVVGQAGSSMADIYQYRTFNKKEFTVTWHKTFDEIVKLQPKHVYKYDTSKEHASWGTAWYGKGKDGFPVIISENFDTSG